MSIHENADNDPKSDTLARVIEALKSATKDLYAADYSIEAWRRGDERSLPGTLGSVRARMMRALELLRDIPESPQRECPSEFLEERYSSGRSNH
jgi:hypothetical protein